MTSRWIATIALIVFAAIAAGCGSDEQQDSQPISATAAEVEQQQEDQIRSSRKMTLTEYGEWCDNFERSTGDYDTFGEALVATERQIDAMESIRDQVPAQMQRFHNATPEFYAHSREKI